MDWSHFKSDNSFSSILDGFFPVKIWPEFRFLIGWFRNTPFAKDVFHFISLLCVYEHLYKIRENKDLSRKQKQPLVWTDHRPRPSQSLQTPQTRSWHSSSRTNSQSDFLSRHSLPAGERGDVSFAQQLSVQLLNKWKNLQIEFKGGGCGESGTLLECWRWKTPLTRKNKPVGVACSR